MADTKIGSLPSLSGASAATNDVLPIVDVSASSTKGITLAELVAAIAEVVGLSVDDLNDVVIDTPTTSQVLQYSGTDWVNTCDQPVDRRSSTLTGSTTPMPPMFKKLSKTTTRRSTPRRGPASQAPSPTRPVMSSSPPGPTRSPSSPRVPTTPSSVSTVPAAVAYGDPRAVPQTVNTQTGHHLHPRTHRRRQARHSRQRVVDHAHGADRGVRRVPRRDGHRHRPVRGRSGDCGGCGPTDDPDQSRR